MSSSTQTMLYNHLNSGRSLSTILIIQHTSESSTYILLPKEAFQQYFILLPKEVYSSYFRKKSFNNSYHSSYFRKKSIHLTSERSLSTFLIVFLTFERSTFILLPKVVFQQFLLFLSISQVNSTI